MLHGKSCEEWFFREVMNYVTELKGVVNWRTCCKVESDKNCVSTQLLSTKVKPICTPPTIV